MGTNALGGMEVPPVLVVAMAANRYIYELGRRALRLRLQVAMHYDPMTEVGLYTYFTFLIK